MLTWEFAQARTALSREDVGFEGFPLQLALDPCPGIVDPGMRISNQTLNLSFSPDLHSEAYRFAPSIETRKLRRISAVSSS